MCQITKGTSNGISEQAPWTRRVSGGSIALLKVNDSQKKQQYTINKTNLLSLSNTREKMTVEQLGLEGRGYRLPKLYRNY